MQATHAVGPARLNAAFLTCHSYCPLALSAFVRAFFMSTLVSLIPEIEKSRIRADVRAGIKDKKSRVIHGQQVGGREAGVYYSVKRSTVA